MNYTQARPAIREIAIDLADVVQTRVNPAAAPPLQKQVVGIVLQAVPAADLYERPPASNASKDFLNNTVFIELRIDLSPLQRRIVWGGVKNFPFDLPKLAVKGELELIRVYKDDREKFVENIAHTAPGVLL
jgi:hypothetical protein